MFFFFSIYIVLVLVCMCTYLNSSVLYIFFSKLKQPFSTFIMSILLPHVMKRPFVATLNLKVIYLDSSIYFFFTLCLIMEASRIKSMCGCCKALWCLFHDESLTIGLVCLLVETLCSLDFGFVQIGIVKMHMMLFYYEPMCLH